MSSSGSHTWQLNLRYHKCPNCAYIVESRNPFVYRMGKYEKAMTCPKCHHPWIQEKKSTGPIGPLFGNESKPEFDWQN